MRLFALLALPVLAARDLRLRFHWPEGLDVPVHAVADTTPPVRATWRLHTARADDGLRVWITDWHASEDPWRALPSPWPEFTVDAKGRVVRGAIGADGAERWNRLVGVWVGTSFAKGAPRTWTETRALRWTGWTRATTTLTASWDGERDPAGLRLVVAADPDATLAALRTRGGAADTATVVETVDLVVDPATLLPREETIRREQRVDAAVTTITTRIAWGP